MSALDSALEMPVKGRVERLEKNEGKPISWRFVLRRADRGAVVVELEGDEIHGSLSEGDEVEFEERASRGQSDVLSPLALKNKTIGVNVSVSRVSSARRIGQNLGSTAATTVVSSIAAAAVTLALASLPGGGGASSAEGDNGSSIGAGGWAVLSVIEFTVLWAIWFAIWGRRWQKSARLWGTLGIAVAALIAFLIGVASS
jgi:hypothetical protein